MGFRSMSTSPNSTLCGGSPASVSTFSTAVLQRSHTMFLMYKVSMGVYRLTVLNSLNVQAMMGMVSRNEQAPLRAWQASTPMIPHTLGRMMMSGMKNSPQRADARMLARHGLRQTYISMLLAMEMIVGTAIVRFALGTGVVVRNV